MKEADTIASLELAPVEDYQLRYVPNWDLVLKVVSGVRSSLAAFEGSFSRYLRSWFR